MNSNCLGLRYSDCTRKIKGNSSKVSEPSILHLDRKLSTMFRLPHVFILPHDLFSTSLYPIKLTWTKIHRHFHPPDVKSQFLCFCSFTFYQLPATITKWGFFVYQKAFICGIYNTLINIIILSVLIP